MNYKYALSLLKIIYWYSSPVDSYEGMSSWIGGAQPAKQNLSSTLCRHDNSEFWDRDVKINSVRSKECVNITLHFHGDC